MRTWLAYLWQLRRTVVALGLIAYGGYHIYVAIAFRTPERITFAEFDRREPRIGWFTISDVPLDYGRAVAQHAREGVAGYYVPAVDQRGKIPFLVVVPRGVEPLAKRGRTIATVSGTLGVWLDGGSSYRDDDVRTLAPDLDPAYRTIDANATPNVLLGAVLGAVGLAIGGLLLLGAIAELARRGPRDRDPRQGHPSATA